MVRTSEEEVRDVYSAHSDGTAASTRAVTFWIDAANEFVTATLGGESVPANQLQHIEALVAAHGLHATDPTEVEFTEGDTRAVFHGSAAEGKGLESTPFGQRAIMLDPSGVLSHAGKPAASFNSFGAYDADGYNPGGT